MRRSRGCSSLQARRQRHRPRRDHGADAAAAANRTEAVALLLSSGADPNVRTRDGATALTAAAFGGYANVVKSLLERRADPAASDQQGRTPMMAAAMNGHTPSSKRCCERRQRHAADAAGATALRYAAARGHADIVDRLSKAGGAWSDAELTLAAEGCHGDVVKLLLDKGGNVKGRARRPFVAAAGGRGRLRRHRASAVGEGRRREREGRRRKDRVDGRFPCGIA
jgi:ankyrin repeat protein